jgi:hypothetical protein
MYVFSDYNSAVVKVAESCVVLGSYMSSWYSEGKGRRRTRLTASNWRFGTIDGSPMVGKNGTVRIAQS